jgi:acyl dehydratase
MEYRAKYFEDWEIGKVFESASRTITEADIIFFAGLSGDYNPLHTDEEFAKKSIFGTRVAHGFLVLSISSGLVNQTRMFEGVVEAFLGMREFRITKGVLPGDTIKTRCEVIEKKVTKQGKGIVTFKMDVLNQRNETCSERLTTLMIKREIDLSKTDNH